MQLFKQRSQKRRYTNINGIVGNNRSQQQSPTNQGFALVIALSLMAFILLLLLSITAITQIETQANIARNSNLLAKQNARLSLYVALGNLQRLSGADQRITASAAIFDTDTSTSQIEGVTHPHWVGVWDSDPGLSHLNDRLDTTNAYYNYNARREGSDNRFLGWLVSGAPKEISARDLSISTDDEVLIYGNDFDQSDPLQMANQVRVQKVAIEDTNNNAGNFAYWISDENIKARIDTYNPATNTIPIAEVERSRFTINQRSAVELIDTSNGLFDFVTDPQKSEKIDRIQSTASLSLLSDKPTALQEQLKTHSHALSSVSTGLLTNCYTSGLKIDLSSLLRAPNLTDALEQGVPHYTDSDNRRVLAKYPPGTSAHPMPPAPTWGQLQSWSQLADRASAAPLLARKHDDSTHGIYPVITRYRLKLFPTVVADSDPTQGHTLDLYFEPIIVLNNPYNSPLKIGDNMWVQVYFEKYQKTSSPETDWDRGLNMRGNFIKWPKWKVGHKTPYETATFGWNGYHGGNYWDNSELWDYTDPSGIQYRGLNFKLPDITLEPGEVMTFGIMDDGDFYNGANQLEQGALAAGTTSQVILKHKDANGDPIRAPVDWSIVEEYDKDKNVNSLGPNGSVGNEAAAVVIPYVSSYKPYLTCLNPKTGGQINRAMLPFRAAIALSDRSKPTTPEHFYSFLGGIEVSNANVIARHHWHSRDNGPTEGGTGNEEVLGSLYNPDAMEKHSFFFDIALGAGFDSENNRIELNGSTACTAGYRINHRWITGHNFRAPRHTFSATDLHHKVPNTLYGAFSTYGENQNHTEATNWPDFELAKIRIEGDGSSYWGTGTDPNDGGIVQSTFFEAPTPEIGLLSLGQLQHMLVSEDSSSDLYGIGGGSAYLKLGDTGNLFLNNGFGTGINKPALNSYAVVDHTYLLNNALWDTFIFSGLSNTMDPSSLGEGKRVPLNNRYVLGKNIDSSDLTNSLLMSKHLKVEGAFNINSHQKEAWKAVLAGGNRLVIDASNNNSAQEQRSPMNRYSTPIAGSGVTNSEVINGYRQLTDLELDALSDAIVKEVKTRGPFLSLADFINRRIEPDNTPSGLRSALETALETSGMNAQLIRPDDQPLNNFSDTNLPLDCIRPPLHIEEIFNGPRGTGISQWISQADLLQKIAPFLNARSDTFIIRGYGEVTDPISGTVQANATCEVVLKRSYNYINIEENASGESKYTFNSAEKVFQQGALSPRNKDFGRRFEIVSIHWL